MQFLYLGPLSFQEYALARGKEESLLKLQEGAPNEALHQEMLRLIREYFIVGGMPAACDCFLQKLSLFECGNIQEILLSTYQADFSKYPSSSGQKHLPLVFRGIFGLITKQFKYAKIDPHLRSRELKITLEHFEAAGLIHSIYASSASGLPLAAQIKWNKFKLLFLDIGLVHHALGLNPQTAFEKELIAFNRGNLAEQFVGQELLAYSSPYQKGELFYWEREKRGSEAEVDYLFVYNDLILPIEVKAGASGRLRSLQQFMQEKKAPLGIRISQNPLSFEKGILSLPFYLISHLPTLVDKCLQSVVELRK